MAKRSKRGRPPIPAKDRKSSRSIFVRSGNELADAVEAFRARERIVAASEAVRQLLIRALKAEGLL